MREFQLLLPSSAGQNHDRDQHGRVVEVKDRKVKQSKNTFFTEKHIMILSAIAASAVAGFVLLVLIFWLVSAHQLLALNQR